MPQCTIYVRCSLSEVERTIQTRQIQCMSVGLISPNIVACNCNIIGLIYTLHWVMLDRVWICSKFSSNTVQHYCATMLDSAGLGLD